MSKNPLFNRSKTRSKVLSFLLAFVIAFVPMVFNFPASCSSGYDINNLSGTGGYHDEYHLYGASTGSRRNLAERGRV